MLGTKETVQQAFYDSDDRKIFQADLADPTVASTQEALLRQSNRVKLLESRGTDNINGVHLMPRWEHYTVLRVGQKRGQSDLQVRGQSAHGVSFGVAQIRTPQGETPIIKVALKPYVPQFKSDVAAPRKALFEASVNAEVLNRGISTTDPVCVIVDQAAAYIITPVKEGVITLDTEPWHQFFQAHPRVRKHFTNRLSMIGQTLAREHVAGIAQGDVQLRNFWMIPGSGLEPFDWESATLYPTPVTPESLELCARNDLERLYNTLSSDESRKILTGPTSARRDQFRDWVVDPYNDALETLLLSQEASDDLLEAASLIRSLF